MLLLFSVLCESWSCCAAQSPVAGQSALTLSDSSGLALFERKVQLSKGTGSDACTPHGRLPPPRGRWTRTIPTQCGSLTMPACSLSFKPGSWRLTSTNQYSARISGMLRARCEVLQRYGLRGVWSANEPAVLPETFFTAHPELRGPRIDQPNRPAKSTSLRTWTSPRPCACIAMQCNRCCRHVGGRAVQLAYDRRSSGFDWASSLFQA